jgi:hypothetical protein
MIDADCSLPYFFPEVVVLDIEVLCSWSHLGCIGNFYILQCTLGFVFITGMPCCFASSNSHMKGITSLIDCESAI